MTTTTDPRAAAEEALRIRGEQPFWSLRSGDVTDLAKLTPILARAVIEGLEDLASLQATLADTLGRDAIANQERDAARTALEQENGRHADTATMLRIERAELASLRAVAAAARDLSDAAHACDREAEQPAPSQSSAPLVRQIRAMASLRTALAAIPTDAEPRTAPLTEGERKALEAARGMLPWIDQCGGRDMAPEDVLAMNMAREHMRHAFSLLRAIPPEVRAETDSQALPADYAARRAAGEGGHGMCEPFTPSEAAEIIASAPGQIAPGQQPIGFADPVDVPPIVRAD